MTVKLWNIMIWQATWQKKPKIKLNSGASKIINPCRSGVINETSQPSLNIYATNQKTNPLASPERIINHQISFKRYTSFIANNIRGKYNKPPKTLAIRVVIVFEDDFINTYQQD